MESRRAGKHELLELLGRGGMGEVWKARDRDLGRIVAVKLLQRGDDADLIRFKREARLIARLSHPHIAQLHEVGEDPPHIVMQLIDGVPLDAATLSLRGRLQALAHAARAVHFAHTQGIIHRDLKPSNILVDAAGRGIVLDFGLARELRRDATTLSLSGEVMGTPAYMAPEQARGQVHRLDARTDVYGLGATLYALIAGRPPHEGSNAYEIIGRVITADPAPPGGERDLQIICLKALEKEPERRYADAEAFAADLDRFLRNEPVIARPASAWYRFRKRVQRQPVLWLLGTSLAAAVVAGTAFTLVSQARALQAEKTAHAEANERALQARARASVDEARALLADVKAALYMEGCTLAPYFDDLDRVRAFCRQAMLEVPDFAPAWYWIGKSYLVEGKYDEAVDALTRATGRSEAAGYMWADLGRALLERGIIRNMDPDRARPDRLRDVTVAAEEAARCYEKAGDRSEDLDGIVAEAYRRLVADDLTGLEAFCKEGVRRFAHRPGVEEFEHILGIYAGDRPGIELLSRVVRVRPGHFVAYVNRGALRDRIGDVAGASADCAEAIRINPRFGLAYYNRGRIRFRQNDLQGALADLSDCIDRSPGLAPAYFARGVVREGLGDPHGAIDDYSRAVRLRPDPKAFDNRGLLRQALGDLRGAVEDHNEALRLDPGYANAYFNRGLAWYRLREFALSATDYNEAIRLAPDYLPAYYNRAFARGDGGDFAGAVVDLDTVIEREPRNFDAFVARSYAYLRLKRPLEAIADCTAAIALKSDDPRPWYNRGFSHRDLGHRTEALSDLKRYLELAPDDADAPRVRAIIAELEGR